jgi:PAS domain-containing protein
VLFDFRDVGWLSLDAVVMAHVHTDWIQSWAVFSLQQCCLAFLFTRTLGYYTRFPFYLLQYTCLPDLQPAVRHILDNALRGRGTSNIELEIRTKDDETRYLLVNATTRRDAENNVVGIVFIAQDVTEAIKHDRAVAAMANELRQLIDTANAPIFGIDRDG